MILEVTINPELPNDIMNLLYLIAIVASILSLIKVISERKIDNIVITIIACCFLLFIIKSPDTLSNWGKNITGFVEHVGGEIVVKK